jgi:Coenzyme F420-dependent N5,N10-methylene tetrahydromethanopterin reductase and related flavin-dependent oxidoreductases
MGSFPRRPRFRPLMRPSSAQIPRPDRGMACGSPEASHGSVPHTGFRCEHTERLTLGTSIAVAFARSPMTVAHTAYDLQRLSEGRFVLGLGSQVKAHIERRFKHAMVGSGCPNARLRGRPSGHLAVVANTPTA